MRGDLALLSDLTNQNSEMACDGRLAVGRNLTLTGSAWLEGTKLHLVLDGREQGQISIKKSATLQLHELTVRKNVHDGVPKRVEVGGDFAGFQVAERMDVGPSTTLTLGAKGVDLSGNLSLSGRVEGGAMRMHATARELAISGVGTRGYVEQLAFLGNHWITLWAPQLTIGQSLALGDVNFDLQLHKLIFTEGANVSAGSGGIAMTSATYADGVTKIFGTGENAFTFPLRRPRYDENGKSSVATSSRPIYHPTSFSNIPSARPRQLQVVFVDVQHKMLESGGQGDQFYWIFRSPQDGWANTRVTLNKPAQYVQNVTYYAPEGAVKATNRGNAQNFTMPNVCTGDYFRGKYQDLFGKSSVQSQRDGWWFEKNTWLYGGSPYRYYTVTVSGTDYVYLTNYKRYEKTWHGYGRRDRISCFSLEVEAEATLDIEDAFYTYGTKNAYNAHLALFDRVSGSGTIKRALNSFKRDPKNVRYGYIMREYDKPAQFPEGDFTPLWRVAAPFTTIHPQKRVVCMDTPIRIMVVSLMIPRLPVAPTFSPASSRAMER